MLPMSPLIRNGIPASRIQINTSTDSTVLAYLIAQFPQIAAAIWQSRFEAGLIVDSSGLPVPPDHPATIGLQIYYWRDVIDEPPLLQLPTILFADEHLIVLDKPHGLVTAPVGEYVQRTALVWLAQHTGHDYLAPLHRLDKETAGLLLFSVQPKERGAYQHLFQQHRIFKTYEANCHVDNVTVNHFPVCRMSHLTRGEPFFRMEEKLDQPINACTEVHLQEIEQQIARVKLHPTTGKQHQLRVHLAALGLPICFDPWYPHLRTDHTNQPPLQLLARSIQFIDPITGEQRAFKSQQQLLSRSEIDLADLAT